MKKNRFFKPDEVIFCPTSKCNLKCVHCTTARSIQNLTISASLKFLHDCKKNGIKTIDFSGGEPFLMPKYLISVIRKAAGLNMIFDHIMTNGVWYGSTVQLRSILEKIRGAGFTGDICISIDHFHKQNINKLVNFIKTAYESFGRNDIISISYVLGSKDRQTEKKLTKIAVLLNGKIHNFGKANSYMKSDKFFIRMYKISLSAVGSAEHLKNHWDGRWFKEDYCKGPGNALFVFSNGDVSSCCGYANDEKGLIIGNIYRDRVKTMIDNANLSVYISTI